MLGFPCQCITFFAHFSPCELFVFFLQICTNELYILDNNSLSLQALKILLVCGLTIFLNGVLQYTEVLTFNVVRFINLYFCDLDVG